MSTDEVHAASSAERRDLADLLERLDDAQWSTPSLCAGWDVRTVAGHLVSALSPSPWPLVAAVLRSGGRPHVANDALARRAAREPTAGIVALLRERADRRVAPPVVGARGPLTDVLVHSGDIRLPLGLPHHPDGEHVRPALDFVTSGRPVGFVPRDLLAGLRLVADDLDQAWGSGTSVTGAGIDLLMAACGRAAVLPRLGGPGLPVLRERLRKTRADGAGRAVRSSGAAVHPHRVVAVVPAAPDLTLSRAALGWLGSMAWLGGMAARPPGDPTARHD